MPKKVQFFFFTACLDFNLFPFIKILKKVLTWLTELKIVNNVNENITHEINYLFECFSKKWGTLKIYKKIKNRWKSNTKLRQLYFLPFSRFVYLSSELKVNRNISGILKDPLPLRSPPPHLIVVSFKRYGLYQGKVSVT